MIELRLLLLSNEFLAIKAMIRQKSVFFALIHELASFEIFNSLTIQRSCKDFYFIDFKWTDYLNWFCSISQPAEIAAFKFLVILRSIKYITISAIHRNSWDFAHNPIKLIVLITVAHPDSQKICFAYPRWDFTDGASKGAHRARTETGFSCCSNPQARWEG